MSVTPLFVASAPARNSADVFVASIIPNVKTSVSVFGTMMIPGAPDVFTTYRAAALADLVSFVSGS